MFVAGLGTSSQDEVSSSSQVPTQVGQDLSRRNTLTNAGISNSFSQSSLSAATEGLKISGYDAGLNTPETRSRAGSVSNSNLATTRDTSEKPAPTALTAGEQNGTQSLPIEDSIPPRDDFEVLQEHLRKSFMRHSAKAKVWPDDIKPDAEGKVIRPSGGAAPKQPSRRMAWRTVLVDKVRDAYNDPSGLSSRSARLHSRLSDYLQKKWLRWLPRTLKLTLRWWDLRSRTPLYPH
jgi:hypothetical protein